MLQGTAILSKNQKVVHRYLPTEENFHWHVVPNSVSLLAYLLLNRYMKFQLFCSQTGATLRLSETPTVDLTNYRGINNDVQKFLDDFGIRRNFC